MEKLILICCMLATPVFAQAPAVECEAFLGQRPLVLTFDAATGLFPVIPHRGEFETTAQYQLRRTTSLSRIPSTIIVSKNPGNAAEFTEYNADTQRLGFAGSFFNNLPLVNYWDAFQPTPYYTELNPNLGTQNYGLTMSWTEQNSGSYPVQNAFGARWTIQRVVTTVKAVYEGGDSALNATKMFPQSEEPPYLLGSIPATPAVARQLRLNLRMAIVMTPKAPYIVRSSYRLPFGGTLENPFETTVKASILVADIKCAILLSPNGTVLASYPTS